MRIVSRGVTFLSAVDVTRSRPFVLRYQGPAIYSDASLACRYQLLRDTDIEVLECAALLFKALSLNDAGRAICSACDEDELIFANRCRPPAGVWLNIAEVYEDHSRVRRRPAKFWSKV